MAKKSLLELLSTSPDRMNRADRRNAGRLAREEAKRVSNMMAAINLSGAGYPIDKRVRSLLQACNDDRARGISEPFTNIWDVMQGFTLEQPAQAVNILRLRPEKDHAFSAADFFAFATEDELRAQTLPMLRRLPEGQIHNYSALGDLHEVAFEEEGKDPVVISGIALVRHGSHLYWISVGGPVCDLAEVTRRRREELAAGESRVRAANPAASEEQIRRTLTPYAVPLDGVEDVWLTFAMGLFNLETASHEIRTVARDWGWTLAVFSDQFEQRYAEAYDRDPAVKRLVDKAVTQVEESRILFDIAETAFILPAYFAAKVSLVTERTVATGLGDGSRSEIKKHALKAPLDLRVLQRRVTTLELGPVRGVDRSYAPPRFKVEVDGFWRRLRPEATGHDRNGDPVLGRTWVKEHARWKDRPPKVGVVHVKSPIRTAIEHVERDGGEYRLRVAGVE